tara:strand:+ start:154 stop:1542 length:1389 start_codon:yes stop_codon:yes gene_type:complete
MKKASSELEKFLARKAFNKKAETSAAAALSIGDLIYDMARIDPTYVKGAQFSRPNTDIDTKFKIGKQNIEDSEVIRPGKALQGEDYSEHLHEVNYRGGVQEFLTDRWMLEKEVEITIPNKMNQPGWDRIYNGEKWQIKGGGVADVREARIEHPEYKVATTTETAATYHQQYPTDADAVLGTYSKSVTDNILAEGNEATMEIHENDEFFDSSVPEFLGIASIVSVVKNISYYNQDKTNFKTAIENVVGDSLLKGGAMWAGATAGSLLGPLGSIVGGIAGLVISKDFIDDLKLEVFAEKETKKVQEDLDNYILGAKKILKKNLKIFMKKRKKIEALNNNSSFFKIYQYFRVKILKKKKQKVIPKGLIDYILKRMNDEYKAKQFILKKLNWSLVDKKESDVKIRYAWLRMGEFKNSSLSKLPQLAQAAIEVSAEAGILPMFLEKEYKQLKKSLKKFIKIAEKRGV